MQDERKHPRHLIDVHDDNHQRNEEIEPCHERHEQCGKVRNAVNPAEDNGAREDGEDAAHHPGINAERLLHRKRDRICLNGYVDQAEGDGDEHSKELCDGRLATRILDIVRGTAVKEPVAARDLVDLGERALDKSRRRANEGDDPHPEYGAGTARNDGDGNTCDVADADARGRTDAKSLERRDRLASARTAAELPREEANHLGQSTQLNQPGGKCEPEPRADEHNDDDISPQEVVDRTDKRIEKIHRTVLSKHNPHNMEKAKFCQIGFLYSFAQAPCPNLAGIPLLLTEKSVEYYQP